MLIPIYEHRYISICLYNLHQYFIVFIVPFFQSIFFTSFVKFYYCYSVSKSCPTLCDPTDCSMPSSYVLQQSLLKFMSTESVMLQNHLIVCCPLLFPSILPSIRVFSNELALHIRWPKCWSFSFSNSPSSEYSGLISFRIDWLAVGFSCKPLLC